ncbi:hypothetical protein [Desulfatiglans anilini]|uniref:hypothetical protein n=1 Tax=Desulfatiglans anilini TaxID=90728 RepID=UPI001294876F|nr:hypothetical protein [Desulfatiglans anilini]
MFEKILAIIRKFFNIQFSNKFADIDPNVIDLDREIKGQYNEMVSKGKIHVEGNHVNKLLDEKLKNEREARINNANMRINNPSVYVEQYERSIRKIISEGDSAVARNLRSIRDVSETADISNSNLKNNNDNKRLQHYGLMDAFEDERLRKEREARINNANMRINNPSVYAEQYERSIRKIISEGDSAVARNLRSIRNVSEEGDISNANINANGGKKLLKHYGLIDAFEDERLRKEREARINDANMRIKISSLYRINLERSIQKIISEGDSVVARNLDNIRSSSVSEGQWPALSWIDEIRKTSSRHKIPRIKKFSWYIRSQVRLEVAERDGGCCAFCGSTENRVLSAGVQRSINFRHVKFFSVRG